MLLLELRFALRRLFREPKYSGIVMVMLAIGIGAPTAIFSVLNAVVLRPLPYPDSTSLVSIASTNRERGITAGGVSIGDFVAWRDRAQSFSDTAAVGYAELVFAGGGEPERVTTAAVSTNLLRVLGVRPVLGRDFLPEEEIPGRDQVILLSHSLWERRFGGSRHVVGRTLTLSGYPYQVIGVLPPGFKFFTNEVGFLSPMALDLRNLVRQRRGIRVVARLRKGTPITRAQREIDVLARQLAQAYPATNSGWGARVISLHEQVTGGSRASLILLFSATLIVLGLAVANVGTLVVSRLGNNLRATMIRTAIGARWIDLIRPHLLENLALSLAGGTGGIGLAALAVRVLQHYSALDIRRLDESSVDGNAITFALGVSIGAALSLTLLPLLQGVGPKWCDWTDELGGRSMRRSQRVTEAITVVELSLALSLLTASGLLLRSLHEVMQVNLGFDPAKLVVMNINLPLGKYHEPWRQEAFFLRLLDRIRKLPHMAYAAQSSAVPLNDAGIIVDVPIAGEEPTSSSRREDRAAVRLVSEDYFRTMRVPLRAGRDLSEHDSLGMPPVALVNEALAQQIWPVGSPLGKHLRLSYQGEKTYEVVGIVGNVHQRGFEKDANPEIFLSYRQHPTSFTSLVVRTRIPPSAAIAALKSTLWSLDSSQDVTLRTMDELVDAYLLPRKFLTELLLVFTGIAVVIAILGVFTMSSYLGQQRVREFCIRIALGAHTSHLVGQVLMRTMLLTALGLCIGLLGAYFSSRYLASFLFRVQALDPVAVLCAVCVLIVAALSGSYFPVRKAAGRDAMTVLRD